MFVENSLLNSSLDISLQKCKEWVKDTGDSRVRDWLFMESPLPTIQLSLLYIVSVTYVGPWLMKCRPPYKLKHTILIYNAFQILFSTWLFIEMGIAGWFTGYSYKCQPMDYSTEKGLRMARICWWFFFSKFTEFFDTLLFVLRKKNENVSFLHVAHHGLMPLSSWMMAKYSPGGHGSFTGLINPFVHIIMYLYYFIAALGPKYEKYIWWKKYLTTLQMVQFIMVFVHAMQLFVLECDYPKLTSYISTVLSIFFLVLFMDFYRKDRMKQLKRKSS